MPKTKIITVSPKIAEVWLKNNNPRNRKLIEHVVDKYARDMTNDLWQFTGDPIQFDTDDNLLNGQHRLSAVIKSNKSQKFLIVEGLEPEAQDAIDTNAVRSAGQQLAMHGVSHGPQLASIVRVLLKWNSGAITGKAAASTGEIINFVNENSETLQEALRWYYTIGRSIPLGRSAIGAFVFKLFELAEDESGLTEVEDVLDFLEKMESGADLHKEHPILALRTAAIRTKAVGQVRTTTKDLYRLCRTWNAYASGEQFSKLQGPRDGVITMNHLVLKHMKDN